MTDMLKQYRCTNLEASTWLHPLISHWLMVRIKHGLLGGMYVGQSGHIVTYCPDDGDSYGPWNIGGF
jgi:hypothetical protein